MTVQNQAPVMITVTQATVRWGIGKSKMYALFASGQIEARKIGTRTLVLVESGDQFFRNLPRFGAENPRRVK